MPSAKCKKYIRAKIFGFSAHQRPFASQLIRNQTGENTGFNKFGSFTMVGLPSLLKLFLSVSLSPTWAILDFWCCAMAKSCCGVKIRCIASTALSKSHFSLRDTIPFRTALPTPTSTTLNSCPETLWSQAATVYLTIVPTSSFPIYYPISATKISGTNSTIFAERL